MTTMTNALCLMALAACAAAHAAENVLVLCTFEQGPRGWRYYDRDWCHTERPRRCALTASAHAKSGRLAGKFIFKPNESWATAELRLDFIDHTLYALMQQGYSALRFSLKGDGTHGQRVRVEVAGPGIKTKHLLGSFELSDAAWRDIDLSLAKLKGDKGTDNANVGIVFTMTKNADLCDRTFLLDDLCLVKDSRSQAGMDVFDRVEPDARFPKHFLSALKSIDRPAAQATVQHIGGRRQLLVDDFIVDKTSNLTSTFHQARKHPQNPLIYPEKGKAGSFLYLYGSVLHDADARLFKMWYYDAEYRSGRSGTRYATSADGLRWTTHDAYIPFITMGVLCDPEAVDRSRRYKSLSCTGGWPRNEYGDFFSPDGIQWKPYPHNPVLTVMASDVNPTIHDPVSGHYVSFVKVPVNSQRTVGVSFSRDFITWTDPISIFVPDDLDRHAIRAKITAAKERELIQHDDPIRYTAEVYGLACMPYDGLYLGIPWVFYQSGPVPGGGAGGVIEPQLMSSRDFVHWRRIGDRQPLIPLGADGQWDCGMIMTTNTPLVVGDEIWIYYGGFNVGHADDELYKRGQSNPDKRAGIGLATWRRDGFVSMDAGPNEGVLLTKPLVFTGTGLYVNCDASRGELRVEILDERLQPMEPFTAAACDALVEDRVDYKVTWQGASDVGRLAGTPVRLRFVLRNANLYAFQFR